MKHTVGIRFGQALLRFFRPLIYCLLPYKIIGKQNLSTNRPVIVCCNHLSALDPVLLLVASAHPIYFMGKDSLFKNKIIAYILSHWFGVFPVSRGHNDTTAITTAFRILENGHALGIFPEGTRSKDGTPGRAKSGAALIAAKMNVPIVPCALIPSKGTHVSFFKKTTLVIGEELSVSDLHLDTEHPDLRYASRMLMSSIVALMEANRS